MQCLKSNAYHQFYCEHVYAKLKIWLLRLLNNFKKKKFKVIGYGATAKSVTVLNYCKITKDLISYFLDTTPDKIKSIFLVVIFWLEIIKNYVKRCRYSFFRSLEF